MRCNSRLAVVTLAFLVAFLVTFIDAGAVLAEAPACNQRTKVVDHLGRSFAERPVALGLADNGGVVEFLTSKAGRSWTLIVTMPDGIACLLAAGKYWESLPTPARAKPST